MTERNNKSLEQSGSYGDGDAGTFDPIAAHLLDTGQHAAYGRYMEDRYHRQRESEHVPGAETRSDRDDDDSSPVELDI